MRFITLYCPSRCSPFRFTPIFTLRSVPHTLNEYQSLLISAISNKADLNILLDAWEDYMLNCKTAKGIILEVVEAIKGWRELAVRLGISKREMDMFSGVLDWQKFY